MKKLLALLLVAGLLGLTTGCPGPGTGTGSPKTTLPPKGGTPDIDKGHNKTMPPDKDKTNPPPFPEKDKDKDKDKIKTKP